MTKTAIAVLRVVFSTFNNAWKTNQATINAAIKAINSVGMIKKLVNLDYAEKL